MRWKFLRRKVEKEMHILRLITIATNFRNYYFWFIVCVTAAFPIVYISSSIQLPFIMKSYSILQDKKREINQLKLFCHAKAIAFYSLLTLNVIAIK